MSLHVPGAGHKALDRINLAAATLQQLGFARATDLAGGFPAWRGGLAVIPPPPG